MFDLARKYGVRSLALASIAAAVALTADPAGAAGYGSHGGGGGYHGGGYHGGGGYRGGYHHGGGWGWGLGLGLGLGVGLGAAYYDPWWPGYYSAYPYYADAPVTVVQPQAAPVQAAPAASTYYYCDNPAGYYPYVQNCSQPWRQVPVTPQR